jgi:hypothetical protein
LPAFDLAAALDEFDASVFPAFESWAFEGVVGFDDFAIARLPSGLNQQVATGCPFWLWC